MALVSRCGLGFLQAWEGTPALEAIIVAIVIIWVGWAALVAAKLEEPAVIIARMEA